MFARQTFIDGFPRTCACVAASLIGAAGMVGSGVVMSLPVAFASDNGPISKRVLGICGLIVVASGIGAGACGYALGHGGASMLLSAYPHLKTKRSLFVTQNKSKQAMFVVFGSMLVTGSSVWRMSHPLSVFKR